jgi:quercetin dioxygenase-like cupin family protein
METTNEMPYAYFENLADSVTISPESIVSRTLHADKHTKSIVFGFDAGQELSEHTASVPATIHILRGEAEVQLGADKHAAGAGSWAWMPAKLPHGIVAKTAVVMLLTMFTGAKEESSARAADSEA